MNVGQMIKQKIQNKNSNCQTSIKIGLFVCLFVCGFSSYLRIFHSYGDVTIASEDWDSNT